MENDELKNDDFKEIDDEKLDQVAGGALTASFSDEEYNAAGVQVIGSGWLYNDGYYLPASGEDLDESYANWAVRMFQATGEKPCCRKEILYYKVTGKIW